MQVADFGPLVVETDVDTALLVNLAKWMPTYLAQVERERDLPAHQLPRPRPASYSNVIEDEEFVSFALPGVFATTAELTEIESTGDGLFYGSWAGAVTCVVRGRNLGETRALASVYRGCVRRIVAQQQILGGVRLLPSPPLQIIPDQTDSGRYIVAATTNVEIFVADILSGAHGPNDVDEVYDPADPVGDPDTPYDPVATVAEVTFDVTAMEE